jgi:WD40 repeat protein
MPVGALAFSRDGSTFVTGGYDGAARVWEAATRKPVGSPWGHRDRVEAVAVGPDGKTVVTGSRDGTARLWEVPAAVPGTAERVALWAQVLTNQELDGEGRVRALDGPAWQQRRQRLEEAGGPPLP